METHVQKSLEFHPPLLNSLDSPKTLSGSLPPNSSQKTLISSDFDDNLSPLSEETAPDMAGLWSSFLDSNTRLNPCSSLAAKELENSKASSSIDWSSLTDFGNKPSVSTLLTEQKSSIVGAGLANLGNTCFLNAILQCFIHTVPLLQALLSCNHKGPCDGHSEGFCVFCNLYEHVQSSLVSTGRIVSPWKFVNNLNYFSSGFRRFQQEDAHEFLQCFLDKLESCCSDFQTKDNVHSEGDNIVKQVFGGCLISMVGCCNCGHWSDTLEPSIDFSLEIEEACDLSTALESFTKLETIEDPETKFTCENCKQQVSVEKQLRLEQVPSVAIFHLKRFKNDGSVVEKIDKYVPFPLELDMQPFTGLNQDEEELKYDLFAVVVHTGFSSTSGHFYCFIRIAPDEWYRFDDSKVVRVQQEYVLLQEAYILFYAKRGTSCFSGFIQTQKQWMDLSLLNTSPKSVLNVADVCTASASLQLNLPSDINQNRRALEQDCTKTLSGTRNNRVDDSQNKEHLTCGVPFIACDASDVASCEVDESTSLSLVNNSSDVPSSEADKSASLSVINSSCAVPSYEAKAYVLNSSDDVSSCEVDKLSSKPVLKETNSNQELVEFRNIGVIATTHRSASPEIHREDPHDAAFSISRGHLRLVDQVSCKRRLNKDLETLEREQAYALIKNNMPGPRGQQLIAAMRGSLSESSVNRKRSRKMHTISQ
ncbi:hypothetical protein ACH5RR_038997 [Cinchona calisaya]|uniref:Ubiquitin carboxyl-terminal hydrolase n=1 Tax=Cinchona calisaya TaxID=153742 RepID=A0ABD2XWY6_9GENT